MEFSQEQAQYLAAACRTLAVANKEVEEALRALAKGAHENALALKKHGQHEAGDDAHEAFKAFTILADVLLQARRVAQVEVT